CSFHHTTFSNFNSTMGAVSLSLKHQQRWEFRSCFGINVRNLSCIFFTVVLAWLCRVSNMYLGFQPVFFSCCKYLCFLKRQPEASKIVTHSLKSKREHTFSFFDSRDGTGNEREPTFLFSDSRDAAGEGKEVNNNQLSIDKTDFPKLIEVIFEADLTLEDERKGKKSILFHKNIEATFIAIFEIRRVTSKKKKKHSRIMLQTLYKKKPSNN
uniref:hypothetical protein n=1 Tax=Bernardetia sp. TaxID=1937974 RepID=UPI0025B86E88